MHSTRIRLMVNFMREFPKNSDYALRELEAVADEVEQLENAIIPPHLRHPEVPGQPSLRLVSNSDPLNPEGEE